MLPILYVWNFWGLYAAAEKFNYFKGLDPKDEEEESILEYPVSANEECESMRV